jgi:predicted GIY-YIG superfamily endonuclease
MIKTKLCHPERSRGANAKNRFTPSGVDKKSLSPRAGACAERSRSVEGQMLIKMKKLFVYILKCIDNSYYTGVTNNLERRVAEHQAGINPECYTFARRPLTLMFYEAFDSPEKAIFSKRK